MSIFRAQLFAAVMVGAAILAACSNEPSNPSSAGDLSGTLSASGDATAGRMVFESQGCVGCHSTGTDKIVGPGLAGVLTPEGPTLPDGVDYQGNLPNGKPRTEANIAAWIRSGGQGQIGFMSGREVNDGDMANLLAYLRTLK